MMDIDWTKPIEAYNVITGETQIARLDDEQGYPGDTDKYLSHGIGKLGFEVFTEQGLAWIDNEYDWRIRNAPSTKTLDTSTLGPIRLTAPTMQNNH